MTITAHNLSFTLTVKEVSVWMVALRMAAKKNIGGTLPWDSCSFLAQHAELVRLTGYGAGDHEDLRTYLAGGTERSDK